MDIDIRLATQNDVDGIFNLFLEQFSFLKDVSDRAYKDVVYRIEDECSMTVVATEQDNVIAVARGYKENDVYVMNSICASSDASLVDRAKIMMRMMPFYVETCIEHVGKLKLEKAFYATESKTLARLVKMLCVQNNLAIETGVYDDSDGFWIFKKSQ